ncbi:MAG: type 4a pilus biogenesis protein PilO [Candidatus Omnitrophica bacterium]|nr:type 4a pilus biogenesis protein PilO [Candidatus Omnitrophota bacterium]
MGANLNLKIDISKLRDLKKIKKEDILRNKIAIICAAVALFSVWYGYNKIYKTTAAAIRRLNAEISSERSNAGIARRLAPLQAQVSRYEGYFEKGGDVPWLVDKVSRAADESGVNIVDLNSKPLTQLKSFAYSNLTLKVKGTFHQLGDFVSKIESADKIVRVEKLSFKKNNDALDADIAIGTYFLK